MTELPHLSGLNKPEALLRDVLETSWSGINLFKAIRDTEGEITDLEFVIVNQAAVRIMGQPAAHWIGKRLNELVPDREKSLFYRHKEVIESGIPFIGEHHLFREDQEFFLEVTSVRFEDGVLVTYQDSTKYQKALKHLQESQWLNEKIANITPGLITVYNVYTQQYIYINKMVTQVLGYEADAFFQGGTAFSRSIIHPDDMQRLQEQAGETNLNQEEAVIELEYRIQKKSGEWIWVRTYQTAFDRNAAGEVEHFINVSVDVTDKIESKERLKRINQELEERVKERTLELERSRQELSLVIDSVPILLSYIDKDYRYRFMNQGYESWFDLNREKGKGKTMVEVLGEEAFLKLKSSADEALAGKASGYETYLPYKSGGRYVNAKYIPDCDPNGKVNGIIAMVWDITAHVEAQEELERKNQELNRINSELDTLLYTYSHDLKAPIANIEGLVDIIESSVNGETAANPEFKEIMKLLHRSVAGFKSTLHDLAEATQMGQEVEEVDVASVIEDVRLGMIREIAATNAVVEVNTHGCPTLRFSRKNLRSIIYNLLSNSLKYRHPERAPMIRIHTTADSEEYRLTIHDNGLGMAGDDRERIFSLFQRLHYHVDGSGVGLYIVRRIVEHAGGRIEVDSEEGVGSEFRVLLPR